MVTPDDGLMFVDELVNAAGLAEQSLLVSPARLVTAPMVMVQLAVAEGMATLLKAIVSGLPCVTTDVPLQPLLNVTLGAPLMKRNEAGNDSVNEMPLCAGLVPLLVNVKTRLVLAASLITADDHALVSVGLICATTKH